MPEGLFGLADPVLDTVLMQDEAAPRWPCNCRSPAGDAKGVSQPDVVVVVVGQLPERLDDLGLQEVDRADHQG
jgi:hypothetical protein